MFLLYGAWGNGLTATSEAWKFVESCQGKRHLVLLGPTQIEGRAGPLGQFWHPKVRIFLAWLSKLKIESQKRTLPSPQGQQAAADCSGISHCLLRRKTFNKTESTHLFLSGPEVPALPRVLIPVYFHVPIGTIHACIPWKGFCSLENRDHHGRKKRVYH